ncbi:MAG: DnaJ C-terminal domain-containing protein [Pseudomonadota bacterium]
MADDPYKTLGVSRSASDDDIRKAFRRLAKDLHPDLRPGDTAASERFKRVSQAYDILGDPEKRGRYDRGEIDGSGEERRGYQSAGSGRGPFAGQGRGPADDLGFGDIFSDFFGQGGQRAGTGGRFSRRGRDARYTLDVDFMEAVGGARKRITLPSGGVLDLTVPVGTSDGQVLRLRGKGQPGIGGGEAGDALVEVKVRLHPEFERVGDDILSEVPIALDEAVLGAKIEIETISGRVQLIVPKGTSSGTMLRLRGKGVENPNTGTRGDHRVKLQIILPRKIDESLAYFMSEWREKNGYDPRKS